MVNYQLLTSKSLFRKLSELPKDSIKFMEEWWAPYYVPKIKIKNRFKFYSFFYLILILIYVIIKTKTRGIIKMDLLNLSKEQSLQLLDLRKQQVRAINTNKCSLVNHKARVALVFDRSGSARQYYKNGTIQAILERVFPIALEWDDNGAMDCWIFDDDFVRLPEVTMDNYYDYVDKEISKYKFGGTKYSPVIEDIMKKYLEEDPQSLPNYVLFITDGDNFDKRKTTESVIESANYPIFWQFVGLGTGPFDYWKNLMIWIIDMWIMLISLWFQMKKISIQMTLFINSFLNEYPSWLENPKVKDLIENKYIKQNQNNVNNNQERKKLFGLF